MAFYQCDQLQLGGPCDIYLPLALPLGTKFRIWDIFRDSELYDSRNNYTILNIPPLHMY